MEEDQVAIELQQLLDAGLLQPFENPWASPLLLLRKKDGVYHLVMDHRRFNSLTKKHSYTLPLIDNSLHILGGSQYFSLMDLASDYWQVELSPKDR